ncbi:MAG: Asp-tRNA(Asn)/Glu-tRNA(Gln) amidotransferase subunit GatC [Cardiobacteriaceae bacterium]|nr:Asp-tRNA(Asn)/Glu-tRNA(Gln) amidotransferase subunit GatC [Cardiobacteriaceae bacterium]
MDISRETIIKTAHLARLSFDEPTCAKLSHELGKIFDLFDSINNPSISALAPLAHPLEETQRLREDNPQARPLLDAIESNAPAFADNLFTVPKVIE